jgi:hypothetical protein
MTIVTEKTIKRIPPAGVSKISELIIDADKDWLGKSILNVGNITPQSDNAFDLGSSTKRIRDLYLAKTSGSILFSDGSKIAEDNANLYWDNVNKRLGIGTNTPGADFDIVRSLPTGNITLRLFNNNTSSLTNNELRIDFAFRDKPAARIATIAKGDWTNAFQQKADLAFYTIFNYAQFLERMRITSDGNVGIGTTTPMAKLDVAGNIRISGGSAPFLKFPDPVADNIIELWGNNLYTIGIRGWTWFAKTQQLFRFESALGNTGLNVFEVGRTTGGTFLSVSSVGNVGIGTTSPAYKLDVNGGIRAFGPGDVRYIVFSSGTSGWVGYELRSSGLDGPAGGIFRNNADNNRVSIWSKGQEAISILDTGKVGIGTLNPATKLDINGNLGIGGVEVITSTRELKNTVVRRLYTADETEVFVTGTTEIEVKFHRIVNSSTHGFSIRRVNVIAELKVSGGTGFLKVYIDGVNVITLSTTSTTYTLVKGSYNVSWADDTIHSVSIRLVNNTAGQTTYNRLYECYVDAI